MYSVNLLGVFHDLLHHHCTIDGISQNTAIMAYTDIQQVKRKLTSKWYKPNTLKPLYSIYAAACHHCWAIFLTGVNLEAYSSQAFQT